MEISISKATVNDINQLIDFIRSVYDQAVAQCYSVEGNEEFYKYLDHDWLRKRLESDHWILKATELDKLLGIIEIRNNQHLSMLFVATDNQRQGIGKKLLQSAIDLIKKENPQQNTLSVHSSPNSTTAYAKMGFEPTSDEQSANGIRFTSMQKQI